MGTFGNVGEGSAPFAEISNTLRVYMIKSEPNQSSLPPTHLINHEPSRLTLIFFSRTRPESEDYTVHAQKRQTSSGTRNWNTIPNTKKKSLPMEFICKI